MRNCILRPHTAKKLTRYKISGTTKQRPKLFLGALAANRSFAHFASLKSTRGNPHALDLSAGELYANPLEIRIEFTLRHLDNMRADAAAFFRLTFADDFAAGDRVLAGDETDS